MLVRAFRLTDKFTNAFLKLNIYLTIQLVERVLGLRHALEATFQAFWATGNQVATTVSRRGQKITAITTAQLDRRMVQRTEERALQEVKVVEDPLIARNRSLSAIAVVLLVALIGLLIWSPPGEQNNTLGFGSIPTRPAGEDNAPSIPTPLPSPSPTSAMLSSISGTLVFSLRQNGQDDLWAIPAGSTQPIRLTDNLTDDRDPAWSPDGTRLAFASRRDGPWDLYIMNTQSGDVRRLTSTMGYEGAPTWSPDGIFLAYEGYNADTGNIDIYILNTTTEGLCQTPCQFTASPLPDLEPAWIPGLGRSIAYVGYRNGQRDILVLSLEGQSEADATNLTNTADIQESNPQWNPAGTEIAYTAEEDGISGIYVKAVTNPGEARLVGRGRAAAWNPTDGNSLFYVTQRGAGSALYLGQIDSFGSGGDAINFQGRISELDWALANVGFAGYAPQSAPLFTEDRDQQANNLYEIKLLPNITGTNAFLSDTVNDSFDTLRRRVVELVGIDHLGNLESAFWTLDTRPEPGQEVQNWHYTGRAIALNRNLIYAGNPVPIIIIREETEAGTAWRVLARVVESAQNGALGEPLRDLPWDFNARTEGDPEAFAAGGRLMERTPPGYYVDITQVLSDFGWERIPADRTWRSNFSGVRFWEFEKRDGLSWIDAMYQIYTRQDVDAFLRGEIRPQVTPLPSPTLEATDIPGGDRPRTPTPLPPDLNN